MTSKTAYIATATAPDGYFGQRAVTFLVYDPETMLTYEVYPHGFHSSYVPMAIDEAEARWLLRHHPAAQRRYKDIEEA